jgi:hypothetical protein
VDMTHVLEKGGLLKPFFAEDRNLFYYADPEELKTLVSRVYL